MIKILLLALTAAHAQTCTTYRNGASCSDGVNVYRQRDSLTVQRPTADRHRGAFDRAPREDLFIYRAPCLGADGNYHYCDEEPDDE